MNVNKHRPRSNFSPCWTELRAWVCDRDLELSRSSATICTNRHKWVKTPIRARITPSQVVLTHMRKHTHTPRYAMPLLLQPEPLSCLPLLSSPTYSSSPLIHFFHFPILSSHSPLFAPPPLPHIPFFLYIYFGFTLCFLSPTLTAVFSLHTC